MRGSKLIINVMYRIVIYCERITQVIQKVENDYNKFIEKDNRMLRDVSAFYILQIGELVNKLPLEFKKEHSDIPWRKIVDIRNRMAHGYDRVKPETLWSIMMEKIAAVNMECRRILFELDPTAEADLREELGETFDAELNLGGDNDADDRRD